MHPFAKNQDFTWLESGLIRSGRASNVIRLCQRREKCIGICDSLGCRIENCRRERLIDGLRQQGHLIAGGVLAIERCQDVDGRDGALRHADRLASEIRRPFSFEDNQVALDASIGLAIFPDDGTDLDALIEKADQAMYAIKRTRKTHRA